LERYLARVFNEHDYKPSDAKNISQKIRAVLGSSEAIGNLRVSSRAIEFDLFAKDPGELEFRTATLEKQIGKILTLKRLDQAAIQPKQKMEVLKEGIQLFNEERFWESHEVLEQIWHPSLGEERDIIQGLILTAAALVHSQKNRNETALRMLQKARDKLGTTNNYEGINLDQVRQRITHFLKSGQPESFRIEL
jgi:uncharacterized protein